MKENKEETKLQSEQKTARFSIKKSGGSTWNVYDSQRGVSILKTVGPNATYNESTVKEVVELLNASQFKSQLPELELIIAEKNIDIIHLRDRIKELESQPLPIEGVEREWISVEERLPEPCDKVTVALSDGCVLVGRLYSNGWSAFFMDGEQSVIERQVTHWQPLPSPPKNG